VINGAGVSEAGCLAFTQPNSIKALKGNLVFLKQVNYQPMKKVNMMKTITTEW